MSVELQDLRWAITVSQHRSLRQAAEALNVRQSTLSRRLRDMEGRLEAELFERSSGGTRPTAAGREFLISARRILSEADMAIRRLQSRSLGNDGKLLIGVYSSLSTGNMHATLTQHHRQYPDVDVQITEGDHEELVFGLANGDIDVAIMTSGRVTWSDRQLPLWGERVVVALSEHHPLARKDVVHWTDLASHNMLIPERGPGPELEHLMLVKLKQLEHQRLMRHDSGLDRLLSLVSAGYGSLLVMEGATGVHYEGVTYREVCDVEGATRLDFAAYWRQSNSNPTLSPFLQLLRQRYPDLSTSPSD